MEAPVSSPPRSGPPASVLTRPGRPSSSPIRSDGRRPRDARRPRQQAILEIIEDSVVQNQAQLVAFLQRRGIAAAQATVSRDIKRLGLIKRPARRGYRYASPETVSSRRRGRRQLRQACEQFLTKIDSGDSLLVLRTLTGRANALAVAIDESNIAEITGTLAGDDTVLLVMREAENRAKVRQMLEEMVS